MPRAEFRRKTAMACALLAVAPSASAQIALEGPACFTAADNRGLTFEVIQQAPPPQPANRAYPFYPLTGAASMQLGSLSTASPGYARYYFQWGNRSNAPLYNPRGRILPRKPNFQSALGQPRRQRTPFTSMARANACTLAQTANVLGLPEQARTFAAKSGITLVSETAQADSGLVGPADTCVLAKGTLPRDGAGVLLDYEVQDGRTPVETMTFLASYATLVHRAGRKAILLLDPIDAPSQRYNGITGENAHAIVDIFDRTTIFLWNRNAQGDLAASYRSQKALIEQGGAFEGSHVLIDFELAHTSLDDAFLVRKLIQTDKLAGVLLWRNGVPQGGSCDSPVNQKIAAIALGKLK